MKVVMLIVIFLLNLTACSPNPVIKTETVYILPDDTLLSSPCKETKVSGGSKPKVSDLAIAHISNFDCVKSFEIKMNDLRTWKSEKLKNNKKN